MVNGRSHRQLAVNMGGQANLGNARRAPVVATPSTLMLNLNTVFMWLDHHHTAEMFSARCILEHHQNASMLCAAVPLADCHVCSERRPQFVS